MNVDLLTLFPGMFQGAFSESILKHAADRGLLDVRIHNIRDFASDKHRVTDDYPYGGGVGMVMKVEPLAACIEYVRKDRPASTVILTTPRGKTLNQGMARELAQEMD